MREISFWGIFILVVGGRLSVYFEWWLRKKICSASARRILEKELKELL